MSQTINFGIDLGTTNSLIASCEGGKVEVFKSPVSWKPTLPSVVAFRRDRILVGEKAKELIGKDSAAVFAFFKRKMGTPALFSAPAMGIEKTAIDLSAIVLQELKTFLVNGQRPEAVVVTIPASFDTVQSNATKKAGLEAGFRQVVLLQEPVAAALAFANSSEIGQPDGLWLVYDLGGGTFDAALVRLENGEMRVVDHEGDNYLGGLDFDTAILEKIIVPAVAARGQFRDLLGDLKNADGRLQKTWFELLYKAEQVKIQLSASERAEIEFEIEDDAGNFLELFLPVSRQDFEELIEEKIDGTVALLRDLLERNSLAPSDLRQIVLVGGSAFIPLVRRKLTDALGIEAQIRIDPTTAIAVGAAFFAATKTISLEAEKGEKAAFSAEKPSIFVKMGYQKTTQTTHEYFTAILEGAWSGAFFRITRRDGGFDTGLKTCEERISEMLPLVSDAFNEFDLRFFDARQNPLASDASTISITHGKFMLHGQPLPHDICLEVDDIENKTTRLELIFEKNSILPLRKTVVRTVSRGLSKTSDDALVINVLEGRSGATPASCMSLGLLELRGRDLPFNLAKGSDVEVTLEISESRDLKIDVYVAMTGQELASVFSPSERTVFLEKLRGECAFLLQSARKELRSLENSENFELAAKVKKIETEAATLISQLRTLPENDSSDARYQIDEQKRKLGQSLDILLLNSRLETVRLDYFSAKKGCEHFVEKTNDAARRSRFERIVADEKRWIEQSDLFVLKQKTKELNDLSWEIQQRDPQYVASLFHHYSFIPDDSYRDPHRAKQLKEMGEKALARQNTDELLSIVYNLYAMWKKDEEGGPTAAFVGLD